jgi:tryptophan 2,3-dioxygenase
MSDESRPERGFDREAHLSYGSYLKVPELLGLQQALSRPVHHDELQFIVVHQVFELWFKLLLFELEAVRAHMLAGETDEAEHLLRRTHAIEGLFAPSIAVLESMTPADFLGFRNHLMPASGFQSVQFREVEILSGLRDPRYVEFLRRENVPEVADAVDRRLREVSLREASFAMLQVRGLDVGWSIERREVDEEKLRAVLLEIYRSKQPRDVYRVLELLVQHDENIALWRQHHVALVERQIGSRTGTGGSSGAAYLRSTGGYRFFPELWRVRGDLDPDGY